MSSCPPEQAVGSLTLEIVTEVAAQHGVDPIDLEPPLDDIVDTDALEALFSDSLDGTTRETVAVEFTYCGHRVVVDEGTVHVEAADGTRRVAVDE